MTRKPRMVTAGAAMLSWLFATGAGAAPPSQYIFTELPAPSGTHAPRALGINPSGTVIVGEAVDDATLKPEAVAWVDGEPIRLVGGRAFAANDSGLVVGWSNEVLPSAAFTWSDGDIELLPGEGGIARAVSNDGTIAGHHLSVQRAVRWIDGHPEFLLPADLESQALGINHAGAIVGVWRSGPGTWRAFLWQNGEWETLPAGKHGSPGASAFAINSHGLIAGQDNTGDYPVGLLWDHEQQMTPLVDRSIFTSAAYALNDAGDAVGVANLQSRAAIWSAASNYKGRFLDEHVVGLPQGWMLNIARGIDESGRIVGIASVGGQDRAFLLEPLPPPIPGDLNGDGKVNVEDLLILLAAWGQCEDCTPGNCPADLNNDCNVGVPDLLILLSNWTG